MIQYFIIALLNKTIYKPVMKVVMYLFSEPF